MSPPMSSLYWLDIGFYSRFSLPPSMAKTISTRPPTTRRSSTWEVPLANSIVNSLACKTEDAFEDIQVDSSAALCVPETRDVLAFNEAQLENLLDDIDSECGAEPKFSEDVLSADEGEFNVSVDDDILYSWTASRNVLVIDSVTPWLTPHIVITPASDTMSDLAVAWFNQANYYQDASKLFVPPPDLMENPRSPYPAPSSINPSPPSQRLPNAVFSLSKFIALIESCSDERLSYFNVVVALRRQTVKAVAILASQVAKMYRKRYDVALPFSNIERPFSWSDPAEHILLASRFHRATLLLDSPNPFRVPHIIINQPPPEDQWLTASNTVNDPQDYGFGRYLVVHARGVSYINEPEDAYPSFGTGENEYYDTSRFEEEGNRGRLEPIAEHDDEDYGESYSSTLECFSSFEELPELDTETLVSVESPFTETPDAIDDGYFKLAFEQALEKRAISFADELGSTPCTPSYIGGCPLERPTSVPFDEDHDTDSSPPVDSSSCWADEEDELPPIDDEWYQSVIRRTQGVANA